VKTEFRAGGEQYVLSIHGRCEYSRGWKHVVRNRL